MLLLAEQVRGYLAALGMRSVSELVGRTDLLEMDRSLANSRPKTSAIDLSKMLMAVSNPHVASSASTRAAPQI
jgi:hypothetical protein